MPNIEIRINWSNANQSEATQDITLKTIYIPVIPSFWVTDAASGKTVKYLESGRGIFSFENLNEPEQGHYNQWEERRRLNIVG